MTRHHAESNINILLTRNLPIDSGVRQGTHPLMIPLHCLWAKSNNRTHGQFECDITWFCFWRGWGEGVCLKLVVQGQGGGKILDVYGQRGGLEN